MKKIILLVLCVFIFLTGCSEVTEQIDEVKKTVDTVKSIGDVPTYVNEMKQIMTANYSLTTKVMKRIEDPTFKDNEQLINESLVDLQTVKDNIKVVKETNPPKIMEEQHKQLVTQTVDFEKAVDVYIQALESKNFDVSTLIDTKVILDNTLTNSQDIVQTIVNESLGLK